MLNIEFTKTALAVTFASTLVFSTGAWAQETATQDDTAEQTEAADNSLESQLSLGEDANAGQIGQAYTKDTSGAWELRCLRTEDPETDPCQLYQLLNDDQGQPVAEVSLFRLPDSGQAKAGATIIVPLETALQNQLTVQVDSNNAKRYPFAFCNTLGCYVRLGFTEDDVNLFRRGAVANITIVPVVSPNQKITLPLDLSGFTAGYAELEPVQQ